MLSVAEARRRILEGVSPVPAEPVPLRAALGRVLAADVRAGLTQPPFATTAMDGYAVCAADTSPGRTLRVIGQSSAGARFDGRLGPGQAVRIFTGAPLPDGADAVIEQERTTAADGGHVTLIEGVAPGRFVRPAGLDFQAGAVGLATGQRLAARHIGLAAAMNTVVVHVRRRPRVAVLATGDELAPPGAARTADQIVSSSTFAVQALVQAAGGEAVDLGIAPDVPSALADRIRAGAEAGADVIVTLGGASVGDHDHVKQVFATLGVTPGFWTIAMRPGKPLVFGRLGGAAVLGLPGNPVSSYVCAHLFLVPLIAALSGCPADLPAETAQLVGTLPANDHREDYLRARIERAPNGTLLAHPAQRQDSSMQAVLAGSDGLIRREPGAPAAVDGETVTILPFFI